MKKLRVCIFAAKPKSDKEEKRDVQIRDPLCIACNKNHPLNLCKIFMEKTKARNQTIGQQKSMLWLLSTYDSRKRGNSNS